MKMLYFLLFTILFIGHPTHAEDSKNDYPTFPQCDQRLIDEIKKLNIPHRVLSTMEGEKNYVVYETSYTNRNKENKCLALDVGDSKLTATLIKKNGGPPEKIVSKVREGEDGHLYGEPLDGSPKQVWHWFTIHACKDVVVSYICSDFKGSKAPPVAVMYVSKNSYGTPLVAEKINEVHSVLKKLGFKMTYKYGSECFK